MNNYKIRMGMLSDADLLESQEEREQLYDQVQDERIEFVNFLEEEFGVENIDLIDVDKETYRTYVESELDAEEFENKVYGWEINNLEDTYILIEEC